MRLRAMLTLIPVISVASVWLYACDDDETASPPGSDGGLDSSRDTGPSQDAAARTANVTIAPYGDASTTTGSGTFTEGNGTVTLSLNVTGAPPGSRGVHVHVNSSCNPAPGSHFQPNDAGTSVFFQNMIVNDAGEGSMTSSVPIFTIEQATDAGTGIVGRTLVVHGVAETLPDGGPVLTDAGAPVPPPVSGCGSITP
jgi:Cu/Zn superoxide dismutase